MTAFLGCIADDYTGASDIASQLAEQGVRTVQLFGVPDANIVIAPDTQVIIIGLKTRTQKVDDAIKESLGALSFLKNKGCSRFYFKYCSTFDSTPAGNIGPVADALAVELDSNSVIFCPAFPKNGRTVYQGHLFVNDVLLSESSLANHPLTPMSDANLVRWLGQQTKMKVGLLGSESLDKGLEASKNKVEELLTQGCQRIIVDTLNSNHLDVLGELCRDYKLVSGGSALAPALVDAWRKQGLILSNSSAQINKPALKGHAVILSGSCSEKTNRQLAVWRAQGGAAYFLDPKQLMSSNCAVEDAINWVREHIKVEPVLVYATSPANQVAMLQAQFGSDALGQKVEQAFVDIAKQLTQKSTQVLIVAGGETSGAVVSGLNLKALTIGPTIASGVPWMYQYGNEPLAIVLKSGNFGSEQFYRDAIECLATGSQHE